jgi:hypothetical protein
VWRKVSDFGGIHKILGVIAHSEAEGDGRVCTTADGAKIEERLVSLDDKLRRVAYAITASPFGFDFHFSSWRVGSNGAGTILEWITDVKPDEAAAALGEIIEGERDNIVRALSE